MSRPTKEESQQCPQGIRLLCHCDAWNEHDCNADLGIVWTAGRTGEILPADEESTRLRPSAQLVGRRQDRQTADPLCRTHPELVCAPHMEANRPA